MKAGLQLLSEPRCKKNILDKLINIEEYANIENNLTNCKVGLRRGRNVWVINAIMNQSKSDPKEAVDISVYDVYKCFNTLWSNKCINEIYEENIQSYKLLLHYE